MEATNRLKWLKSDFYIKNNDEASQCTLNGVILAKEEFFKYAKNVHFEPESVAEHPELKKWYPLVNSYYPYGTNADPLERVHHLLDTKPSYMKMPRCDDKDKFEGMCYSERAAENFYLQSNPLCFIILGKPGLNEEELGKQLAEYWRCEYIEPNLLIQQEIESGSRAGQCMEFNLRNGKSIGIDVILRLVEKRVTSETSKHRGFVISGLPLIPNNMYDEEILTTESAIFAAKEIIDDLISTTLEQGQPPQSFTELQTVIPTEVGESEQVAEESKPEEPKEDETEEEEEEEEETKGKIVSQELPPILEETSTLLDLGEDQDVCHPPKISTNFESQLNFLFNLLKKPFFIIHLICSPRDCIVRRKNLLFDVSSKTEIDLVAENTNNLLYTYFTNNTQIFNEVPQDSFESYFHNIDLDSKGIRHLVHLPQNFPANIEAQLDAFYYTAVNFIERRIMTHEPQYFIKVDNRTSVRRMLYVIKARLSCLPVHRVVVPERIAVDELLLSRPQAGEGLSQEGTQEQLQTDLDLDNYYESLRTIGTPSENFKWNWSDWSTKCPVFLKNGACKEGDPNFAVHFLNKIYLLADEEAYLKFRRNPRPYIIEPNPLPTCKFLVFGPPSSGKTSVSRCIGYYLDGKVLSTRTIQLEFIENKEKEFYAQIREEATATAIAILNEQRVKETQILEARRIEIIKEWLAKSRALIEQLELLNIEREKELKGETKFELSSFPMAMAKLEVTDLETETSIAIGNRKDELQALNIPSMEIQEYVHLLKGKKIFVHLPVALKKKNVAEPATDQDKFVIDFVNKAISSAQFEGADLIEQNMIAIMLDSINTVEEEAVKQGKSKGGWIVDGMHCDLSVLKIICEKCKPDYAIILKDTESYEFLRERYKTRGVNQFREYRKLFLNLGKLEAAWRTPSQQSTISYKNKLARQIVSEIFDDPQLHGTTPAGDLVRNETYYADLLKFNVKWLDVEEYINGIGVHIIQLEVTNKTMLELLRELVRTLDDLYRIRAMPLSDKDRAEETQGLHTNLQSEVGEVTLTAIPPETGETPMHIRRYGDTYHFCPVTFRENWVLWKGKEQYAVKFQERLYLLSGEQDYIKFLQVPRDYITGKLPTKMPPPRICIIGSPGFGKTTLSVALAANYGLHYISYESFLKNEFHIESDNTLEQLKAKNLLDDELREYLFNNSFLPESCYDALASFWFEDPVRETGFVLDDFPKRPVDVEIMVKMKLIPDIIIELLSDETTIKNNMVQTSLDHWEANITTYLIEKQQEFEKMNKEWGENRHKKFYELLEEKREQRYAEKRKQKEEEEEEEEEQEHETEPIEVVAKTESLVSFDSLADQQDIDEINRLLDIDMPVLTPEPIETSDQMRTKLYIRFTEHIDMENNFIIMLRNLFEVEGLPYSPMNMDLYDKAKNIRCVYCLTEDIKYRNISHFESCYEISFEIAQKLLACGYCFLSKFGKLCPVYYRESKEPILLYLALDPSFNIFPVIHRSYIYYIRGEKNLKKFKSNPLLYVNVNKVDYPLIPMKLAVTGPPKCGKTTLAKRVAQEYGLKVISRGAAIRYVLLFLPFSNLAEKIERVLRNGWEVTDEMVAKSVEAATIDPRGVTQGFIFDGFPNTIVETRQLSYFGLIPHLVINLQATKDQTLECYSSDVGRRGFHKYSVHFIKHLREEWKGIVKDFELWFDKEYQITYKISIDPSIWSIWHRTKEIIGTVAYEIKHYFVNCEKDWPLRLAYMQVSPLEFLERTSSYKSFCPCCLRLNNILTTGGSPPDRTGLVQWREYFYWICNEHMRLFLRTPDAFISPYGKTPPEHLPAVINLKDKEPKNLFEDGFCVTCYRNNTIMVKGVLEYAIFYQNSTYLFDSNNCLQEFLKQPLLYCWGISFRPPDDYPALDYKNLPTLGMLEQYVAKDVIKAIKYVSRRRPVIPGLSALVSGAIGVGLHLKISNQRLPIKYIRRYEEASELFYERREKLLTYLEKMKRVVNPYLNYEEPLPPFHYLPSSKPSEISSTYTQVTHIVDDIVEKVFERDDSFCLD